ncbi:hypothetical protein [Pseudomaricurvus sp. HS19]|uniref:hypothetical protein n=1 Tax=Pseudomaricurvus sp. HS19 TaxID=2692626 RepID=UPI00136A23D9|nr:hypothetical protein [Pseudomaricurvus sp. HS19]MYM62675.1 hypothetical protein [Pseudomaricurvus sp. HS19]
MIRIGWPQRFKRKPPVPLARQPSSTPSDTPTHHSLTRHVDAELARQQQTVFNRSYQQPQDSYCTELGLAALEQCAIILAPLSEQESLGDYTRRVMMELNALEENYAAFGCDTEGNGLAVVHHMNLFIQAKAKALSPSQ